jgi:hypothetical protein
MFYKMILKMRMCWYKVYQYYFVTWRFWTPFYARKLLL